MRAIRQCPPRPHLALLRCFSLPTDPDQGEGICSLFLHSSGRRLGVLTRGHPRSRYSRLSCLDTKTLQPTGEYQGGLRCKRTPIKASFSPGEGLQGPKGEGAEGTIKSRRLLRRMYCLICTQSKRRNPAVKCSQRRSYTLVHNPANVYTNAHQTTHYMELNRALPSTLPMQMATTSCVGLRTATATCGTWTEALPCSFQNTSPCRASLYCAPHGTRSSIWQVSTLLYICSILLAHWYSNSNEHLFLQRECLSPRWI